MSKLTQTAIENRAARYYVDLGNDRCTPERRKKIEAWLAKDPLHRITFDIIKAANDYAARRLREALQRGALPASLQEPGVQMKKQSYGRH